MDLNIPIIFGLILAMIVAIAVAFASFAFYKKRKSAKPSGKLNDPVSKAEIGTTSKRVPIIKIMTGQVDMPSEEEFDKLFRFEDDLGSRLTQYQGKRNDGEGGRNLNRRALPFDKNRVKLKNTTDGNDYINASWIVSNNEDGTYDEVVYSDYIPYSKIEFIVGQTPLPNTKLHHYQMLHENKVDIELIISFAGNTKALATGKVYHTGNLSRRVLTATQIFQNLIMTEIEFFDTTSSNTQYKHPMTMFEIACWPTDELTDAKEANAILEAICMIRKYVKGDSNNIRIMVHDSDGGIAGAACIIALYHLLQAVDESLNEKNEIKRSASDVEVFREVNKLRYLRANMVDKFSGYKMLYQCLSWYGQNKAHFDQLKTKSQKTSKKKRRNDANTNPSKRTVVNNKRRNNFPDEVYFTEENEEDVYVN